MECFCRSAASGSGWTAEATEALLNSPGYSAPAIGSRAFSLTFSDGDGTLSGSKIIFVDGFAAATPATVTQLGQVQANDPEGMTVSYRA